MAVVVLATLLTSIIGLLNRTPEYKATARVLINPLPQTDEFLGLPVIRDSGDPTRTMQTAASLLESPGAARATAERLGGALTARRVLDRVDLEPEGQSNILDVTAREGSVREAVALANGFAQATLQQRNAALRRQIAPLVDRLTRIRARLGPSDPSATDVQSRIVALEELRTSGDPSTELSRLAGSAAAQGAPAWLIVVLALVAGVVLASVAALLKELLGPRTVRSEAELAGVHPAPVLARVPASGLSRRGQRSRSPLAAPPEVLTSFRSLEFQLAAQEGRHDAILFTSPSARDGTTDCVIGFALTLASARHDVVLLDLDLDEPELAPRLGVRGGGDLETVLASGSALARALAAVPARPAIKVLPGVADPEGALLESLGRRLPDLIAEARSLARYVLIDTAPLGESGDGLRFIPSVDDVVLVARLDHTTVAGVETARDLLHRAGRPATGYVVIGGVRSVPTGVQRRPAAAAPQPPPTGRSEPMNHAPATGPGTGASARTLDALVAAGLLERDAELIARANGQEHVARLRGEQVELYGRRYGSLSAAAASITGKPTNGWTFWRTRLDDEYVPLAKLRAGLYPPS